MNRAEARTQMLYDLEELQTKLRDDWLESSLPTDWKGIDHWYPGTRPTTRVTIRLDADMVRWFRKRIGHGYGQRINLILRIYWKGLLGGQIKAYPSDDNVPRMRAVAHEMMQELRNKGS